MESGHPSAPWGDAWPPPPEPPRAPRRRALALVAALAAIALVVGTAAGVAIRAGSSGQTNFPGLATDDTVPDRALTGDEVPNPTGVDVHGIADEVSPAIVNLLVELSDGNRSAGSGLLLTSSGLVLTNNHVISGATDIQAEIGVTSDEFDAEVLGYDMGDDVALLRLEDASGLPTIETAPSSTLARADGVVAIGNRLGQFGPPAAVPGVVTALEQSITAGDGPTRETLVDMIRFSGSLRPGDSGGALVDADGKVVGMNTAADAGGRFGFGSGGTGFAIPIERAVAIAEQIRRGDDRDGVHIGARALLGVFLSSATEDDPFGDGARVTRVGDDTPAADAGLEAGATIVGVARREIRSNDDLRAALDRYHPGDRVTIHWIDGDGDPQRAAATLTEGPPA
jgi:S1-C subfamily serine protease